MADPVWTGAPLYVAPVDVARSMRGEVVRGATAPVMVVARGVEATGNGGVAARIASVAG